jgi:DNA-binding transcriptional MerR regulator
MRNFSVSELAQLAGVSVRTLHYYDKIGLLVPAQRTDAGYRYYAGPQMLRLQQILFYKELDFSLKDIIDMLDDPEFSMIDALMDHRKALEERGRRISQLLVTIDKTIDHLKNENIMLKPENLYEGLPREFATTFRSKAIDDYGKAAVEDAESSLIQLGKEGFEKLKKANGEIAAELFKLTDADPGSVIVQQLIEKHYKLIRQFWGTAGSSDRQAEAYAGLGQLYVNDPRFTIIDGKPRPEYATFMNKAMGIFADRKLK